MIEEYEKEISSLGYFTDVERLANWCRDYSRIIRKPEYDEVGTKPFRKQTTIEWKRFETMISKKQLDKVNQYLKEGEPPFETINIADLLFCVNNAKDHNRGSEAALKPVSSTGKKILNLLLFGRMFDGNEEDGCFTAYEDKTGSKDIEVVQYLRGTEEKDNQIKCYYYLPGRTVSIKQLQRVGTYFANAIKDTAYIGGLEDLRRVGIVECVDKSKELYKLSFKGCKQFLKENMIKKK